MEIIGIIIVLFVVLLISGSIDNARPVSKWSDAKLKRMYPKLINVGHLDKAYEVKQELDRRAEVKANELSLSDGLLEEVREKTTRYTEKYSFLLRRTMEENKCTEEQASEIIGNSISILETMYVQNGLLKSEAEEAAINKVLGI